MTELRPIPGWRIESKDEYSWYISLETGEACLCGDCAVQIYRATGDVGKYMSELRAAKRGLV